MPVVVGRGVELADAFAASIGPVGALVRDALDSGTVAADELRQIGEAIHPSRIAEGSDELGHLRRFLFGAWGDAGGPCRQSTAWLLLDAYAKGVTPGDTDQLRTFWYNRMLPNGVPYAHASATIDRWRAYQANEYCHIALECLLNGIVGFQAGDHPEGIEPRRLVAAIADEALPGSGGSWADWATSVAEGEDSSEHEIASRVLESIRKAERPDAASLRDAFRLLGRLWVRWEGADGDVRKIITVAAGRNGRSLDGVFSTLDEHANALLHDAATALLQRHIITDHQTIAGHKLAAGTFTYHFLVADGLVTDGEVGAYAYTTPRLGNFTRLLRDAKLIEGDVVTSDGGAFLEQNQPI